MTEDAHVPTEQETAIYDALYAGDQEAIDDMREDAHNADQDPPTHPPPDDWRPPVAQFNIDYDNAWNHYQADHEAPERDRIEQTAEQVQEENTEAPDG